MSCSTIRRKMDRALDADAAPLGLASEIESHTGACAACRREWESLRFADRALRTPRPVSAPPGMLEDFHRRRAAERQSAPPRRPGWWLSAGVAAAAACAAIVSFRIGVPLPAPVGSRIVAGGSPALLREAPAGFGFNQVRPGGGSSPARAQSDPNEYARKMQSTPTSGVPGRPPSGAVASIQPERLAEPAAKAASSGGGAPPRERESLVLVPAPPHQFRLQRQRQGESGVRERRDFSRDPGVAGQGTQDSSTGQPGRQDLATGAGALGGAKEAAGLNGRPVAGAEALGQVLASLRREVAVGGGERSMSQIGAAVSEQLGISVQTSPGMGDRMLSITGGSEPAWRLLQRLAAENGAVIVPAESGIRLVSRDAAPQVVALGAGGTEQLVRPGLPGSSGGGGTAAGARPDLKDAPGGRGGAGGNANARGALGATQPPAPTGAGGFGGGQQAAPQLQNANAVVRGAPAPVAATPAPPGSAARRQNQIGSRSQATAQERTTTNAVVQSRALAQTTRPGPPGFAAELWIGWGDLPARVFLGTGTDRIGPRRE